MRTKPSEKIENEKPQAVPGQYPTRAHRHGNTRSVAENNKRQLIRGEFDRLIFQAHMSSENLGNKHDAYRVHLLRPLDYTIRDIRLLLTDKSTQFVSKFIETIWNLLGL